MYKCFENRKSATDLSYGLVFCGAETFSKTVNNKIVQEEEKNFLKTKVIIKMFGST